MSAVFFIVELTKSIILVQYFIYFVFWQLVREDALHDFGKTEKNEVCAVIKFYLLKGKSATQRYAR